MKDITVILDNGHGNNTPGKRSPVWKDGSQLFEYEFNRSIVELLLKRFECAGVKCINIVPEDKDVSLKERCKRANRIYQEDSCIYVSIHANAGGGTGFEVFTSPGVSKSDSLAEFVIDSYQVAMPELRLRADIKDGDKDKEEHFYVLVHTAMPAILVECAFMDTLEPDCNLLMSEDGRDRMANAIYEGIIRYLTNDN